MKLCVNDFANKYCFSLCIIYAVFTFANFAAAPIVNLIGSKYAMAIGAACYATFLVTFMIFAEWLLYLTSAILGFGASSKCVSTDC